jgi:hypothetical protein
MFHPSRVPLPKAAEKILQPQILERERVDQIFRNPIQMRELTKWQEQMKCNQVVESRQGEGNIDHSNP